MVAQAAHLVLGLGLDVELEVVGARLPVVAEHEVLPDHDAQLVADGVELVGLVVTAAPVADHVHVGVARGLQNAAIIRGGDAVGKAVEWDNVRALGEDGNAVDDEAERTGPTCPDAGRGQSERSPALTLRGLDRLAANCDLRRELIERLLAIASRIPELRLSNLYGKIDDIAPRMNAGHSAERDRLAVVNVLDAHPRRACRCGLDLDLGVERGQRPCSHRAAGWRSRRCELCPTLRAAPAARCRW